MTRGTANCVTLGKQLTSLCFSFLNGIIGNEILCPGIVVKGIKGMISVEHRQCLAWDGS